MSTLQNRTAGFTQLHGLHFTHISHSTAIHAVKPPTMFHADQPHYTAAPHRYTAAPHRAPILHRLSSHSTAPHAVQPAPWLPYTGRSHIRGSTVHSHSGRPTLRLLSSHSTATCLNASEVAALAAAVEPPKPPPSASASMDTLALCDTLRRKYLPQKQEVV